MIEFLLEKNICQPDKVTYSILIDAYNRVKQNEKSMDIFQECISK